jgi:hypothetical protein
MNPLLLSGIFDLGKGLIDRLWPDPAQKAAAALELARMQQNGELAQLAAETDLAKLQVQVNLEEAKSANWFVAGWRPFIGWTCGCGLAYVSIIEPVARFAAQVWFHYTGSFPVIDTTITMQVLLGMLGLAAARTVEKVRNVEGNR